MNEISFNDKFESAWCRDTLSRENSEAIKQPVLYIVIRYHLIFLWNNIHLKTLC
jgi:hypothetical protein